MLTVDELLAEFRSEVLEEIVPVLSMDCFPLAFVWIVTVATPPTDNDPTEQVTNRAVEL